LPSEGEACAALNSLCANGLSCDKTAAAPTCIRLADLGQSCERSADCLSQLCDAGTCAAPALCAL
jgi:hypothetical protein